MAFCRQINETEKNVTDDTEGCSDMVKNSQKDSVKITADVFYEECQTQGNVCFRNFAYCIKKTLKLFL